MASRSAAEIRPWLVDFIMNPSTGPGQAQRLHILKYLSGPHEDGSIVKEGTDRDVSIYVRFTKTALDTFATRIGSQSEDTHEEFNRAFIILRKYRVDHKPAKVKECSRFELVVDDFVLWMNESGLRLKVVPLDCIEVQLIRERSDKLWTDWSFKRCMNTESDTDVEQDDDAAEHPSESMNTSIPLTQLLDIMGELSPPLDVEHPSSNSQCQSAHAVPHAYENAQSQCQPQSELQTNASSHGSPQSHLQLSKNDEILALVQNDLQPVHGGLFTKKQDLAVLKSGDLPQRYSATTDNMLFIIDADQQQKLSNIPEWRTGYIPHLRPYSCTSTSDSLIHSRSLATVARTRNREKLLTSESGAVTPGSDTVTKTATPQWRCRTRSSNGSFTQDPCSVLGTITVIDPPKATDPGRKNTSAQPSYVCSSVQVGDSLLDKVPGSSPSRQGHPKHTEVSAQVGDSLLNPLSSQSQSQGDHVLHSEVELRGLVNSDTSLNATSSVVVSQTASVDLQNTALDSSVRSPEDNKEPRISNDDLMSDTQGQRISSSGEKSTDPSDNSGETSSNSINHNCVEPVRISMMETIRGQRPSSEKEDEVSYIGTFYNTLPGRDVGDYAERVNLSCSRSSDSDPTCSQTLRSGDDTGNIYDSRIVDLDLYATKGGSPPFSASRHTRKTASLTTHPSSGSSKLVPSLNDKSLARRPLHSQNAQIVIDTHSPTWGLQRLRKKSFTKDSTTVRNTLTAGLASQSPRGQRIDSSANSAESISEQNSTPKRTSRTVAQKGLLASSAVGSSTEGDGDRRNSLRLRNRSVEKHVEMKQSENISSSSGSPRGITHTANSPTVAMLVSDHMDSAQHRQSPYRQESSSSGSSSESISILYSPPHFKSQHREKIVESEDIVMPTPPKVKRMQFSSIAKSKLSPMKTRPSAKASLNIIEANCEVLSGKGEQGYANPSPIPLGMFYNLGSSPNAKCSLVPVSPSISSDSSPLNLSEIERVTNERLVKVSARNSPQIVTRSIKADLCMTLMNSTRKNNPYHSTQISHESEQSTLPPLHISPIHSKQPGSLDMTQLRSKLPVVKCSKSRRRSGASTLVISSPQTLGSPISDQDAEVLPGVSKLVLEKNKRCSQQDAESSNSHRSQTAFSMKHRDDDMEESDRREVLGGKSPRLMLERIGIVPSHSSSSDQSVCVKGFETIIAQASSDATSVECPIQNTKMGTHHNKGRAVKLSSSGLSSGTVLHSVSLESCSSDSSIACLGSQNSAVSPIQGLRRNTSDDSVKLIEPEEADRGQHMDNSSIKKGNSRPKSAMCNRIRSMPSKLQTRIRNRMGEETGKATVQSSNGVETEEEVRLINSPERQIRAASNWRLKGVRRKRTNNRIVESDSDMTEGSTGYDSDLIFCSKPVRKMHSRNRKSKRVLIEKKTDESIVHGSLEEEQFSPSGEEARRVLAQRGVPIPRISPLRGKITENKNPVPFDSSAVSTVKDAYFDGGSEEDTDSNYQSSPLDNKKKLRQREDMDKASGIDNEVVMKCTPPTKKAKQDCSKWKHQQMYEKEKKKPNEIETDEEKGASSVKDHMVPTEKTAKSKRLVRYRSHKVSTYKEIDTTEESSKENSDSDYRMSPCGKRKKVSSKEADYVLSSKGADLDEISSEYDSDEEYVPSPKFRNVVFLSGKSTRRNKDRSQLSLHVKAAAVSTKAGRSKKKKMNIRLTGAGKMELVSEKDSLATDVNMILGGGSASKRRVSRKANNFNARKRKLYSDRVMFGDPMLNIKQQDATADSIPPLLPINIVKNKLYNAKDSKQNPNKNSQKVPQRITAIVKLLSAREEGIVETPVSPLSLHQTVVSPEQNLIGGEEAASFKTLGNSSPQMPPARQDAMESDQHISLGSPMNSLPSHQPQTTVEQAILTKNQCVVSKTLEDSLHQPDPPHEDIVEIGRCVSFETHMSSLPSHQPQPTTQATLPSGRSSAFGTMEMLLHQVPSQQSGISQTQKLVSLGTPVSYLPSHHLAPQQPASRSIKIQFKMEDVKRIMAAMSENESNVLTSIEFPAELIGCVRDYFSRLTCIAPTSDQFV